MVGDGEQRDVRESLGSLERRLLDLERELRTDASEDATVAAGAPAPPQKGKGKRAAREAPASEERGGGVAAPPAPAEDIDLFARDARAKVAALRETLDGLTSATDRLRETAQTVVEDHGRALVRLERATGAPASIVIPAAAAAAVTPPPEAPVAPRAPEPEVTPEPEPEAAPEPEAQAAVTEPEAPAPAPEPAAAPDAAVEPADRPPTAPPRTLPPWRDSLPPKRFLLALAAIAVVILGYTVLSGGNDAPQAPAGPTGIAATDAAITAAGGGITAIPDLATGVEADVQRDLCSGKTAAAIHVVTPGGAGWSCPGIRQVAAPVLVASGFARQTKRGRTCVSVPAAPGLDRRRRDEALTTRRDEAVRRADRARAFTAGAAFDRRNGLTLLAGAAAAGKTCITPTATTLRNGTYPLSTRLVLYSTADAADSDEVRQAAARLRSYFAGTPPLYAVVLR